jgi:hypothetical protein
MKVDPLIALRVELEPRRTRKTRGVALLPPEREIEIVEEARLRKVTVGD